MNTLTMSLKLRAMITLLTAGSLLTFASAASAAKLKVTITNLSPTNGTFLTPLWVGFHNGGFDIYDRGVSLNAFPGTEALIEDGNTGPISAQFNAVGAGTVQGTITAPGGFPAAPVIDPGETTSLSFEVDRTLASSRYFSYASMIIPSNDAFIANGNPLAHPIFDNSGNFIGADFIVLGSSVLDGGTEVNDESTTNTAFFGQATPNTGVDENGIVALHSGFIPGGPILSDPRFANANFLAPGYQVARIQVELVPEPLTILGSAIALGFGSFFKRKLSKKQK
ncbi:PEP-CTERM sorting domain-containing protein [Aphanothece sacrum]|uniref:CHRD domain-containing protein n=1 Tax=Aphanothece sacrum FPU1 TaxID=1920663 RepID=A0A401IIJ0_APHSA|nr:PEP-CTERM sorting domain-containing protein [Aphanothece sacrum]GBF81064.1 CHRD domain-containing protein [Aphanothece sacrum FPU1]GBF85465.1 hypothetical protein AsFPU3_2524 [Aphanothece sacrum FPU3]